MNDTDGDRPIKSAKRGPRDIAMKERKSEIVAFRLTPDLQKALKAYLNDRPRESQTGLIVDLLEGELTRLGYYEDSKPEPDLLSSPPGSREAVAEVAQELTTLTAQLLEWRRRLGAG